MNFPVFGDIFKNSSSNALIIRKLLGLSCSPENNATRNAKFKFLMSAHNSAEHYIFSRLQDNANI